MGAQEEVGLRPLVVFRHPDIQEVAVADKACQSGRINLFLKPVAFEGELLRHGGKGVAFKQIHAAVDQAPCAGGLLVESGDGTAVFRQRNRAVAVEIPHRLEGQRSLRPAFAVGLQHFTERKVKIGIAVDHENLLFPCMGECKTHGAAGAQRFALHDAVNLGPGGALRGKGLHRIAPIAQRKEDMVESA